MRTALLAAAVALLAGFLLGALALDRWRQQFRHREAVMTLLQTNLDALRRARESGACSGEPVRARLARIEAVGGEIEDAFLAPGTEEPEFRRLAAEFRAAAAAARAGDPTDCAQLDAARATIGRGCKACHDVYRG